jgi:hypothetical protein
VVMTHRPLRDNELFEIRLDRLVDKWSGSIEVNLEKVFHIYRTLKKCKFFAFRYRIVLKLYILLLIKP